FASGLTPQVVIAGLSAHIDHAVDGGAAAQHLAAWIAKRPPVQSGFGLCGKTPVGAGIANAIKITDGDVNPGVIVLSACLQQQHGAVLVCGKPVREGATCRARANHDVIVGVGHDLISSKRRSRYRTSVRLLKCWLAEEFLSNSRCIELAYDSLTEEEDACHEDDARHDRYREVGCCEIVLQRNDEGSADDGAYECSDTAQKRHEDHFARHLPADIGQRCKLEDKRLQAA